MRIEKRYIAEDGTIFDNEQACIEYEQALNTEALHNYILCFDYMGRCVTDFNWGRIKYCKVMPNFINAPEQINDAWLRVMDGEFDECVCNYEDGWYFLDDYDRWQYWPDFENEFHKVEKEIRKLKDVWGD